MADFVGTAGALATRDGARTEAVLSAVFLLSASLPDQFATTRPVASAVATTRPMPMAVSFHGLFQLRSVMLALLREKLAGRLTRGSLAQTVIAAPIHQQRVSKADARQRAGEAPRGSWISRHLRASGRFYHRREE